MDRKPVEDHHRSMNPIIISSKSLQSSLMFGGNINSSMKRSASELDFEEFLRPTIVAGIIENEKKHGREFRGTTHHGEMDDQHQGFVSDHHHHRLSFSFGDDQQQQEKINGILSYGGGSDGSGLIWSDHHQSPTPKHPCISTTIDSQSSICGPASSGITFGCTATGSAGSPTSALNPQVAAQLENQNQSRGGSGGASSGSDDNDDIEIDAGSCEQSMGTIDVKRIRRKVSNRESARRSRRRKQAHLVDLELQVDQLRGENASLFKQYNNASQHLTEAATDNRVLKSDVEALRVKVKLAEDMVARGSLTCSMNHLLQNYSSSPQQPNTHQVRRVSEISRSLGVQADDTPFIGVLNNGQVSTFGLDGADNSCIKQRMNKDTSPLQRIASVDLTPDTIVSEVASCLSEIWPWNVTGSK